MYYVSTMYRHFSRDTKVKKCTIILGLIDLILCGRRQTISKTSIFHSISEGDKYHIKK